MVFGGTRRRGLNLTSMSEDGSISIPLSTPNSLSEHPRDEKFERAWLSTMCPYNSETIGDGVKMFNGGQEMPAIEHLRTQTLSKMGPLLYPVPAGFNALLFGSVLTNSLFRACLNTTKPLPKHRRCLAQNFFFLKRVQNSFMPSRMSGVMSKKMQSRLGACVTVLPERAFEQCTSLAAATEVQCSDGNVEI